MGPAPAERTFQGQPDFAVIRPIVPLQQRRHHHDHAGRTISALRRLFVEKCLLPGVKAFGGAESFQGGDLRPDGIAHRVDAGVDGPAIDVDGASTTAFEPTSVFRRVQAQLVAKHVKQRGVRRRLDLMLLTIDGDTQRERSC